MANFPWPGGNRCAVALTFDDDGECVPFVYDPQNATRRLTLQSEATYGPEVGTPRILDLMARHDIPASFFIPGLGQLLQGKPIRALVMFILAGVLWIFLLGWIVHLWSILDAALYKRPA